MTFVKQFLSQKFWLLKRKCNFWPTLQFWSTLRPISYYKNVKILPLNYYFHIDWSLNFHLSYHLHWNSKIHFLTLTSHFENFWSIVQCNVRFTRIFSVKSIFFGKNLPIFYSVKHFFWEKLLLPIHSKHIAGTKIEANLLNFHAIQSFAVQNRPFGV